MADQILTGVASAEDPFYSPIEYSPTNKEDIDRAAGVIRRSLIPHTLLLQMLLSRYQAVRYNRPGLVLLLLRLVLRSARAYRQMRLVAMLWIESLLTRVQHSFSCTREPIHIPYLWIWNSQEHKDGFRMRALFTEGIVFCCIFMVLDHSSVRILLFAICASCVLTTAQVVFWRRSNPTRGWN